MRVPGAANSRRPRNGDHARAAAWWSRAGWYVVRIRPATTAVSTYPTASARYRSSGPRVARSAPPSAGPSTEPMPFIRLHTAPACTSWEGSGTSRGSRPWRLGLRKAEATEPSPWSTTSRRSPRPASTDAASARQIRAITAFTMATRNGRDVRSATKATKPMPRAPGSTRTAPTRPTAAGPPRSWATTEMARKKATSVAAQSPTTAYISPRCGSARMPRSNRHRVA